MTDLRPGAQYNITVIFRDGVGTRNIKIDPFNAVPVITANITEDVDRTSTDKVVITYTEETGDGVFDEHLFSINAEKPESVFKLYSDTDRVVRFHVLTPGYLYTITARTRSGYQLSSPKYLQVLTVPGTPTVTCDENQTKHITIAIERPAGGIAYYMIDCSGHNCETQRHISPSDGSKTFVTYQSLTPLNFYTFNVSVFQTIESQVKRSAIVVRNCSTLETAPHEVESFELDVGGYNVTLTWTEPLVKNGRIRYYVLTYIGTKQGAPMKQDNTTTDYSQLSYTFAKLTAGYKYIFTIRAVNVVAGAPTEIQHYFPILAPSIAYQYLDNTEAIKPVVNKNADPSATELSVRMVNPFTDMNGFIVGYSVIVATSTTQPGHDSTLMNWSQARKVSFKRAYIAIYHCMDLFDINSDCGYKTTQTRLKRDTGDEVTVEMAKPLDASETSSITITIVASVVSFVVGCTLVGVIVCCVFRSKRRAAKHEDAADTTAEPSSKPLDYEIVQDNTTGKDSVSQQATENTPYEEILIKPIKDEKSQYMALDKPINYENMVDESSEYYNNPKQSTKESAQYQKIQYKN